VPPFENADLLAIQGRFTGKILQSPPLYSNVRVEGVRGHMLARSGSEAEPAPREVEVHALVLHATAPDTLTMHCTTSSGTYIRSLARDIAARLGTCGHLTSLRRTSIGAWSVPEIAGMAEWGQIIEARADFEMLDFFPSAHVTHAEEAKFLNGNPFSPQQKPSATGILRIAAPENFLGLCHYDGDKIIVEKVYPTGAGATFPQWRMDEP